MAAVVEQVQTTELRPAAAGRNPWALAWRRLRSNRIALAALGLFVIIVLMSVAAPLYAHDIAHISNPFAPEPQRHDQSSTARPCRSCSRAAGC